ncbi:MAG: HAMP domain-containing sensor histidine kinase [Acidobacteriota bacterium]
MFSRWRERLRHTLGFRLALWYAVVFVASSLAIVGLTYVLLAATLRQYDRETLQSTIVQFAGAYARGGVDGLASEIRTVQLALDPGPLFVRTVGASRDVVFLSMPDAWRQFDLSQLETPALSGEQTWATLRPGTGGAPLEVASVRLADGTLFQVGRSTGRREELLRRFRGVLLVDLALLLLTALGGGAVLTWYALQPVRRLSETVRDIMRTGRTDRRVPADNTADALGELSGLVNAMLDRIDAVVAGMRGALDNVAHDLRTPMARLRATAESALAESDPAVLRDALADCLEESDRVMAMLSTLMDISEAETGTMALHYGTVDLGDLIRQSVDLYEDLAEQRDIRIESACEPGLRVPLDRSRMRQVIANLLDNAVKYTPPGGLIRIEARRDGADALLSVSDTGIGIPADELPRIWDRLYRGDKSRSERGLGLGLSLVRAIVEAHRGTVSVQSAPDDGSRFELRLPANLSPL